MLSKFITVHVSERQVPGAVSQVIADALASLTAGLDLVFKEHGRQVGTNARTSNAGEKAKTQIEMLEKMAVEFVVADIHRMCGAVKRKLSRQEKTAQWLQSHSSCRGEIVLGHHQNKISGHCWIKENDDGAVVVQLSLYGRDSDRLDVTRIVHTTTSFDLAYDFVEANEAALLAEFDEMISALEVADTQTEA